MRGPKAIVMTSLAATLFTRHAARGAKDATQQIFGVVGKLWTFPWLWAFLGQSVSATAMVVIVPGAAALVFGWLAFAAV